MSSQIGNGVFTQSSFSIVDKKMYAKYDSVFNSKLTRNEWRLLIDEALELVKNINTSNPDYEDYFFKIEQNFATSNLESKPLTLRNKYEKILNTKIKMLDESDLPLDSIDFSFVKKIFWKNCNRNSKDFWYLAEKVEFSRDFVDCLSEASEVLNNFFYSEKSFNCKLYSDNLLGTHYRTEVNVLQTKDLLVELLKVNCNKYVIEIELLKDMLIKNDHDDLMLLIFNDEW